MLESLRPVPRLCVLTKPSGGHEYGFNLHAERGRGQFVGAVDAGSAADMAGLQPNDHIVAVNTKSIEGLSHKEVVELIKSDPVRCTLLVLDEEGVLWLKERNLPLSVDYLLDRLGGLEEEEHNVLNGDSKQHSTYYYEQAVDVPPQPTPRRKKPPNEQPAEQQPISQRGHYQQQSQLSPAAATSPSFGPYGTEESGSCSIALALSSSAGSPHSDLGLLQQQQQTPVQLLSSAEEVQQHHQEHHQQQQQQQQQQNNTSTRPPQFQSAPIGTSSFVSAQQPKQQQNQTSTFQQPPAKSSTSPSPTPPTAAAAIGRHAAVPLPPPATLLANGPKPRLCTLQKASPSQEFGFNLHAERGKGHFVGTVDADGIARRAGLETGQRIVGVNGRLVFPNSPHKEIVQLIKRDPLRTELLVASEEVDRFYAEYGLAFSYDYVQVYDGALQNGHGAGQPTRGRQMSRPSNGGSFDRLQGRQKRADSGDISQQPSVPATNSAFQHRPSLGQRPPTPTSTYTQPSPPQQNGAAPLMAVAVQIERRPDNMTSIEIGELEEPLPQRHIGIGTPPSSRCDEKSEKEEEPTTTTTSATLASAHQLKQNGTAETGVAVNGRRTEIDDGVNVDEEEKEEEHKHVIAGNAGGRISPPSSAATTAIIGTPQPQRAAAPTLLPLSIVPPSLHQQQHENKNPLASESPQSRSSGSGSPFEKRTFGSKDIFALNAKEARKAICGRKRDPRIEAHMTLEEKHRLILNL